MTLIIEIAVVLTWKRSSNDDKRFIPRANKCKFLTYMHVSSVFRSRIKETRYLVSFINSCVAYLCFIYSHCLYLTKTSRVFASTFILITLQARSLGCLWKQLWLWCILNSRQSEVKSHCCPFNNTSISLSHKSIIINTLAVKQIMVLGIRTISFAIKARKITRRDLVWTVMDGTFKRF